MGFNDPIKSSLYAHSVYLQPTGDDRVLLITIVDKAALGLDAMPPQVFCMAHTSINIYTGERPSIQLDIKNAIPANEWGKQCGDDEAFAGRGVSGLLKSAVWFCKKLIDPLGHMR